uniref:Uncharacterized protein n=1 Tax=Arundo donax TaxID=35708 RepID=A0A0A8YTB0_ARUDO
MNCSHKSTSSFQTSSKTSRNLLPLNFSEIILLIDCNG